MLHPPRDPVISYIRSIQPEPKLRVVLSKPLPDQVGCKVQVLSVLGPQELALVTAFGWKAINLSSKICRAGPANLKDVTEVFHYLT